LIRKFVLGTASVLALGIGGAALDYAADPSDAAADSGNAITAGNTPAVSQTLASWRSGDFIRKDDIRWAQLELRYRDSIKDRSMASWVPRQGGPSHSSKRIMV
jgi:hypothetical protein